MDALVPLALAVLAFHLFKLGRFLFSSIVTTGNASLSKYGARKDAWAVVTGASGGIGREFAIELAKRKFNIVLIARSADKLKEVEKEVESKGAKVKVIQFDFSTPNAELYNTVLLPQLNSLDIGVLVNNVGTNVDYPEFFADHTQGDFENLINTNIRSVNQLTHLLIKKLAARKGAAIINVSSQSATLPAAPMLSVYAGTKGYLIAFSRALAAEYKSQKVDVVCITPGMVVSNMSKRRKGWDCPLPSAIVRPTLNSLGSGNVVFSPYFFHQLIDYVVTLAPAATVGNYILGLHKSTKARAIKKFGERKK